MIQFTLFFYAPPISAFPNKAKEIRRKEMHGMKNASQIPTRTETRKKNMLLNSRAEMAGC